MDEILVGKTPLLLPAALEGRREEFVADLVSAFTRLRVFSRRHGWEALVEKTFVDSWEVYDDKAAFDCRLCELCGVAPGTLLPATFSAALERRVLVSVSPEVFQRNYPQGDEPEAFAKLLCHELAHRLHIRILDGNEEAMGPVWFYEGFAQFVADQFAGPANPMFRADLQALFADEERGDYRRYAQAFRQVAALVPSFPDFVLWPGLPDFRTRLDLLLQQLD